MDAHLKRMSERWSKDSIRTLIDQQARSLPDDTFLIDTKTNQSITYGQLRQQVRALAHYIADQGIRQGDSVAFAMSNGHVCAISILAIMYGGYRCVAVNLVAGRDVIAYVLEHSESALILTSSAYKTQIIEALDCDAYQATGKVPAVQVVDAQMLQSVNAHGSDCPTNTTQVEISDASAEADNPAPLPSYKDDGLLMYTSGTTGRPKGVVLSHGNLIAGGLNVAMGHELTPDDRALCVLPLYHINGLCVTLFGPLVSSGSVVIPPRFSTSGFWQCIDQYRCTWFSVVPTQIAYLLRDATVGTQREYLRFGRSASAPLSPDVHRSFEQYFSVPLIETMGLTETAAQILTNPMPPAIRKLGSPGLSVGCEVVIVNDQMQALDNGVEGELLVRGDNVMQRYFKNPEATAEALLMDGWLRTGDLGRKDKEGYLFITGRLKELIIKGGENIAPREIDDALYQHQDVVEAAAFACPCDSFGQRVEAAVTLRKSSTLNESDLINLCAERVGKFKCPDRIHFLDELPKGPSGKIQRQKLVVLLA